MQTATVETSGVNRDGDGYESFISLIRDNFEDSIITHKHLFTTNVSDLFDVFLANLPHEARQHYTCHACKRFVNTYGGLVSIAANGSTSPIMWSVDMPVFFQPSVQAMKNLIHRSNITGIFLSNKPTWGEPVTGEWCHMAVVPPRERLFSHSLKTPFQAMAEKVEDYQILQRSLHEFTTDTVEQAVNVLKSEVLYRSERLLGVAEWLLNLHKAMQATQNEKARTNLVWLAVASAPVGFAHVRSSMIGTLLDDIQTGMTFDAVSRRFAEKMNPTQYQRAQVAPTAGGVQQAEKIVKQLGLENSLQRRYVAINEIPEFIWRRRGVAAKTQPSGVFDGIATKQKTKLQGAVMELPVTTITWEKFQRIVLPTATKIEIKAENSNRFAALVTAVHPDSPNILQWDNGVSWYYHGGVDAEIKRRVESAGGRYEDNEIRCSLIWENYTDLDLHCISPGNHIFYGDKQDRYGGWLDVDANGGRASTMTPVENIRWASAPVGNYQFYIHNYCERANRQNWYKAELEVARKVFAFEGMIGGTDSRIDLASFQYQKGAVPSIRGSAAVSNSTAWNLEMNQFHAVTSIVKSPNLWGDNPVTHAGDHTFFLIDGCKDTEEGKGRGFFNEMLKPDLREIRKTLEAFTANTPIAESENSPACGLGFSRNNEWNVTLRVTTGNTVATYKLDRWD